MIATSAPYDDFLFKFQVEITGIRGTSYRGDIAIDELKWKKSPCRMYSNVKGFNFYSYFKGIYLLNMYSKIHDRQQKDIRIQDQRTLLLCVL